MTSVWSNKWKKCLIWFSAYISFIAFAIVGGYVIIKPENEELKKSTKLAFVVSLIFAGLSAFLTIFYNFAGMSNTFYGSGAYDFYDNFSRFVNIAKIVVFAVFIVIELIKKEKVETKEEVENA